MVFPLWLVPALFGPGRLVLGSIENAAADGKRLCAIDALADLNPARRTRTKTC
jgi:hypothetical protein